MDEDTKVIQWEYYVCDFRNAHIDFDMIVKLGKEGCKSDEELFLCVFHEYMHIVLFKIGMGFRAKLETLKIPNIKYIVQDNDQEEENIIYTLTETLGKFLYKQYENRTISV